MSNKDVFSNLDDALKGVVPIATRLLGQLWNHAMGLLVRIHVMRFFRSAPWLFAVVIFLTMAFILPVGIVCLLAGFVAISRGAKAENDFFVALDPPAESADGD